MTKLILSKPEAAPTITLDRARRYFLESVSATAANDVECRSDAAYYHNDQISAETKAKWKKRGQPPMHVNKISPAIMGVLGIIDAAQTSPQCFPRSPDQQGTADIATKIMRFLNDATNMSKHRATLSKDFFLYGTCAAVVGDGAKVGAKNLKIKPVLWEDFFYDPMSREHDFSDAAYLGIRTWLDATKVQSLYGEAFTRLGNPFDGSNAAWFDSKGSLDDAEMWLDRARRRVRVIELYYKDDSYTWQRVVFCEAGILQQGPSAYFNDEGERICPIVAASYEVNRLTGERYGPIRAARPIQDAVNARHSKLVHETNNRRIRQTVEGIDPTSKEIAMLEIAKADGALPYGWEPVIMTDIVEGQFMLLQQSQTELDRLFPTPAVLGRMRGSDSGKARQVLQEAGMTEWSRSFGYFAELEETINRHLWFGARRFMTSPQWIRVTGEHRAPEFVQINVPVGSRQELVTGPDGQPVIGPDGQPQLRTVPVLDKALAQMDVDIILDTVPETSTLEHETTQEILRYAASTGISPLDPQFKALLMMFPLPNKTVVLERFDAIRAEMMQEQAAQMQQQAQQQMMMQQLQAAQMQSKAAKDGASAEKSQADAALIRQELRDRQIAEQMFAPQVAPFPQQFGA